MWQWLRRNFVTGFFVTVPLVVSVVAIVYLFRLADRMTSGIGTELFGAFYAPGLGIVVTLLIVLLVGVVGSNVFGRRLVDRVEGWLMHVPIFRTVYGPVRQLLESFSPDNERGFKRLVLVDQADKGLVLGFLTKEFTVDRGRGPERFLAIYVPTNNLYLGDIVVSTPDRVTFPEMSVEEGIRVFLTGGMGLPEDVRAARGLAPKAPNS
jgi:uncharacterized membrane protein